MRLRKTDRGNKEIHMFAEKKTWEDEDSGN